MDIKTVAASYTVDAFFSGELTCSAGEDVVNDNYYIVESSEGVTSTAGSGVEYTTIDLQADASQDTAVAGDTV